MKYLSPNRNIYATLCLISVLLFLLSCKSSSSPSSSSNTEATKQAEAQLAETPESIDASLLERLAREKWHGDLDGLRERRYIRTLVLYNKTNFFYDGPQPRGITYEALKEFEKFLNTKLNTGAKPIHLVFIPVTREEAFKRMKDGRGDLAASNFPIIPEVQQYVDFSDPVRELAKEVVVTGPA